MATQADGPPRPDPDDLLRRGTSDQGVVIQAAREQAREQIPRGLPGHHAQAKGR